MTGREVLEALSRLDEEELGWPLEMVLSPNERHVFPISDVQADSGREIIRLTSG